jgi:4-methyl-5(b-hydroxyethyl)-thiazole monophosphate biosynthesis
MVVVLIATGFEEVEALSVVDILRRANIDVKTASTMKSLNVVGSHNIEIKCDVFHKDINLDSVEMIVLPGGLPGSTNLDEDENVAEGLSAMNDRGGYIGAICAAPMVLGHLGILDDKKATIYPTMEDELGYAQYIEEENVVVDGNIITSQGPATAMPFALKLIEVLKGKNISRKIGQDLLYW